MDAFSYLSVLLSIILGLGLTQLLTAIGRLVRHRRRVRTYWLPLLWAVVLLVIYVQVWWTMFGLRRMQTWTFFSFLIVLLQTATLYLMTAVALPEEIGEAGVDLAAYYNEHHRWFFGFFLATLVVSVLKDVVLSGQLPTALNLVFHGAFGATCILALLNDRRRVQEAVGVMSAVFILVYIGLLFTRLQ